LAEKSDFSLTAEKEKKDAFLELSQYFDEFRVDLALQKIWSKLANLDKHINENAPWSIKNNDKLKEVLEYEIGELCNIAELCKPFIPGTSEKILKIFRSGKISSAPLLFPRI